MEDEGFFYRKDTEDPYYRVIVPDEIPHLIRGEYDDEIFYGMMINSKLEEEYPHIYESIKDENYFISDYESCYYFFEIPGDNDEIIGFASLYIYKEDSLILNQIYVLPEYRNGQQFYTILNYFMELFDEATIYIKNANRRIMEKLEDVEILVPINERFYVSSTPFFYDLVAYTDTMKYTVGEYIHEKKKRPQHIATNIYDKKLNAMVSLASKNNKVYTGKEKGNVKRCSLSMVKDEDQKQYDYLKLRREDKWIQKGNYFKKLKKLLKKQALIPESFQ